jgi:hypothetical protein
LKKASVLTLLHAQLIARSIYATLAGYDAVKHWERFPQLPIILPSAGCRVIERGSVMVSANKCRNCAAECLNLSKDKDISNQVATLLMSMARSWTMLANARERYDQLLKDGP